MNWLPWRRKLDWQQKLAAMHSPRSRLICRLIGHRWAALRGSGRECVRCDYHDKTPWAMDRS